MRKSLHLYPLLILSTFFLSGAGWEVIAEEDGITVLQKEVEGRSLPIFKGEGNVNENLYEILGVLRDIDKAKEWMHACIESKLIKAITEQQFIVYNRTEAPWPISDRDVVIQSEATYNKKTKTVMITMQSIETPEVPEVDGVVRMPRLRGRFNLQSISDKVTFVTYEIDADPGGLLPHWIVRIVSRDIPYITLINLRKRVKDMAAKGVYKETVQRYRQMGENFK